MARAREVMVDLAPHGRRLAAHGFGEIGVVGGCGVGNHGQRGLERVRQVTGVTPRLLGLCFGVRQQLVDLLD